MRHPRRRRLVGCVRADGQRKAGVVFGDTDREGKEKVITEMEVDSLSHLVDTEKKVEKKTEVVEDSVEENTSRTEVDGVNSEGHGKDQEDNSNVETMKNQLHRAELDSTVRVINKTSNTKTMDGDANVLPPAREHDRNPALLGEKKKKKKDPW